MSQSNLKISCKGTEIEPKECIKYLGATSEQCQSGETRVKSIIQKANTRLKFLFGSRNFLICEQKSFWLCL